MGKVAGVAGATTGSQDEDKFNDEEDSAGGKMEDTSEVGQKRKRYITVVDQAGKKRKVVDM